MTDFATDLSLTFEFHCRFSRWDLTTTGTSVCKYAGGSQNQSFTVLVKTLQKSASYA